MVALLRATRRDDHAAIIVDTSQANVDCRALAAWRDCWLGNELAVIALGPDDRTRSDLYVSTTTDQNGAFDDGYFPIAISNDKEQRVSAAIGLRKRMCRKPRPAMIG